MKTTKTIYKSSITGKFVSKEYAEKNPDTTYKSDLNYASGEDRFPKKINFVVVYITASIVLGIGFLMCFFLEFCQEYFIAQFILSILMGSIAIFKTLFKNKKQ